jgi:hypothetical protein
MINNWGAMIRINLDNYLDKSLIFQKSEELTKLSTLALFETRTTSDGVNIPISDLPEPYLSGYEANFSAPFGMDEILKLKMNPFGLVKFWDNINYTWRYGWLKEAGTEPIDKKTNWKIAIASKYITPIEQKGKLLMLNGQYVHLQKDGDILLYNQIIDLNLKPPSKHVFGRIQLLNNTGTMGDTTPNLGIGYIKLLNGGFLTFLN